jgi:hypothetical protein
MMYRGILRYSPRCIDLSEDVGADSMVNPMKSVTWGAPRVYSPVTFPESDDEGSLGPDELDDDERL